MSPLFPVSLYIHSLALSLHLALRPPVVIYSTSSSLRLTGTIVVHP
jgi:hypothetical protein